MPSLQFIWIALHIGGDRPPIRQARQTLSGSPGIVELAQAGGVFGPPDMVPLVNDLIPTRLIDTVVYGLRHRHPEMISGLLQNDGAIFPIENGQRHNGFCRYCRAIRSTPHGKAACAASDVAAARLLAGRAGGADDNAARRQPSLTGGTINYLCHANNLELVAPVRLFLGGNGQTHPRVIAGLWGGQLLADEAEMEAGLADLSRLTGIEPQKLRDTYYGDRNRLRPEQLRAAEEGLLESAEILSHAVTDAYALKMERQADRAVTEFDSALDEILGGLREGGKAEPDATIGTLESAARSFCTQYHLRGTYVYRVKIDRPTCATPFFGWPTPPPQDVPIDETTRQRIAALGPDQAKVVPTENLSAGSILRAALSACRGRADDQACVYKFAADGKSEMFIWATFEARERSWYIHDDELQPALRRVFEQVAPHVASCLGAIKLVLGERRHSEELEAKNRELENRQRQTHQLAYRMAHLVSRPIMELRMSAQMLYQKPSDPDLRVRFNKCLFELRRAAGNFQSHAKLIPAGAAPRQEHFDGNEVQRVVERAVAAVRPLALIKRRDITIEDARRGPLRRVAGRADDLAEVIENLLHNAIKYSFGGRPVSVELLDRDNGVAIQVTNHGCGVLPDEHEKIFKGEYRSPLAKVIEVEGAGIGLSISRHLAEMNGAKLTLVSSNYVDTLELRPGRPLDRYRTTFELWVPWSQDGRVQR
jgi:signal transduction histidine kinase